MDKRNEQGSSYDFSTISDDSKKSMQDLRLFMEDFSISEKELTNMKPNFICTSSTSPKCFFVNKKYIPKLMTLINQCYSESITTHYSECQDIILNDSDDHVSGFCFEFKFETNYEVVEFERVVPKFVKYVFDKVFKKNVLFDMREEKEKRFYCFFLSHQGATYDQKTSKYNSKFRIVIPQLMMSDEIRFYVYHLLWQSAVLRDMFIEDLKVPFRECFQRYTRLAPIPLLGSCTMDEEHPLGLSSVLRVQLKLKNEMIEVETFTISNDKKNFPNLCYDMSINYEYTDEEGEKRGMVSMYSALLHPECIKKSKSILSKPENQFYMKYDKAKSDMIIASVYDNKVNQIYETLKLLGSHRFETTESWMEVMKCIGSYKSKYGYLAVIISMERAKPLLKEHGYEFDQFWEEAINCKDGDKYSIDTISFWSDVDQPSKKEIYQQRAVRKMLISFIRHPIVDGEIGHSHIARCLAIVFSHQYLTVSEDGKTHKWYGFATPSMPDTEELEYYKWKKLIMGPAEIHDYLSNEFESIATYVQLELKDMIRQVESQKDADDNEVKRVKGLLSRYQKKIKQIYNHTFKETVIKELGYILTKESFLKKLDKTPQIMGVGNGVIEFNSNGPQLINYHHTYPITLRTDTEYVEYDENCPYVQTIYNVLYSLVPDDERDALEFLLYYFSTSLDWHPKESIFLIIHGGGSNGKSVLLELLRLTLGEHYARKLPLSFITDTSTERSGAANPAIMDLEFARMVYYSESAKNEKLNIAKVKEITGNEIISGRQLYGQQKNFKVNSNHIVTTNHRFAIRTVEYAVWRRIKSYKFKICFKQEPDESNPFERKRDPELIHRIMNNKRYLSAFLSILVHYRQKLYDNYKGQVLAISNKTIERETEEYRQSEDTIYRFVMTNLYVATGESQGMIEVIQSYKHFCLTELDHKVHEQTINLIHEFRQSTISEYIKEIEPGNFVMIDLYAPSRDTPIRANSMLFSEWLKQEKQSQSSREC